MQTLVFDKIDLNCERYPMNLLVPYLRGQQKLLVSIEPNIKIETYIETPLLGFGKLLAGIKLINNLTMILDGPRKRLCIATYEEQKENE